MENQETRKSREVLSAKISSEALSGWRDFCLAHGVTLTAMLEVAGLELAKESNPPIEARQIMIRKAREIDLARRVRKPRNQK